MASDFDTMPNALEIADCKSSAVRAFIARSIALTFDHISSIGFKSGL
jgi:hypothetical protein